MKKFSKVLVFVLAFVTFATLESKAQVNDVSLKHHNGVLTSILTKYKGQQVDYKMAIAEAEAYAEANGLQKVDGKTLGEFMNGINSTTAFVDKLLKEKRITQGYYNFVTYFDKFAKEYATADSAPTMDKLLKVIDLTKKSTQYTTLNEVEQANIDFFLKQWLIVVSFGFLR